MQKPLYTIIVLLFLVLISLNFAKASIFESVLNKAGLNNFALFKIFIDNKNNTTNTTLVKEDYQEAYILKVGKMENVTQNQNTEKSVKTLTQQKNKNEEFLLRSEIGPLRTSTDDEVYENDNIEVYEVKNNDNIKDIAKLYNVSVNTIVWANDIKNKKVKEGDILIILPVTGVKHIAKEGDTVESIAKLYKADKQDILEFNSFALDIKISKGDEVIVPDGEMLPEPEKQSQNEKVNKNKKPKRYAASTPLGYFVMPVVGCVKTQGLHGNNGVDIGCPLGTPLMAAAEGVVSVAKSGGWNGGYGSMIIISHPNGTQTVYGHLSQVGVYTGEYVSKGQSIGATGNSGKSTGPHLHVEVRGGYNPF